MSKERTPKKGKMDKQGAAIQHKKFWDNNERFADLFNTVIFNGEKVIAPEELQGLDTDVSQAIKFQNHERAITRRRDVFKQCINGTRLILLGIENQTLVHYAMPLRTLLYDVLEYVDQVTALAKVRQKEKGLTRAEFLSGMRKEDRLHPTLTIVIYYGEEPWDGPVTLKDMLEETGIGKEWCLTDHKMYLVQVCNQDSNHFDNKEVEEIFAISQAMFQGGIDAATEKYGLQKLSSDVTEMVASITGANLVLKEEEGVIMCKKVDEWIERKIQEITDQVTEQVTAEVTEQVTAEVTEQVTAEVTEQVTAEVTEQVTAEVTEQVTAEITEQVTAEITEQVTAEITEKVAEQNRIEGIKGIVDILRGMNCTTDEICEQIISRFSYTREQVMECIC